MRAALRYPNRGRSMSCSQLSNRAAMTFQLERADGWHRVEHAGERDGRFPLIFNEPPNRRIDESHGWINRKDTGRALPHFPLRLPQLVVAARAQQSKALLVALAFTASWLASFSGPVIVAAMIAL